jgi:prevent-host-death family protein
MKTLPLADVKAHLSALMTEIESEHGQITVTRNGTPAAVVISVDEWESLQETIAVLSDQQAIADLREAAESETYDTEDVLAAFTARTRGHRLSGSNTPSAAVSCEASPG